MSTSDIVYPIKTIFGSYLGDDFFYNIPAYQRGYKWQAEEVQVLLSNIYDDMLLSGKDEDQFYCLHNITISYDSHKRCYNVIDGQQRLTTLLILLSMLGDGTKFSGKIYFPSRPETNEFIDRFIINSEILEYFVHETFDGSWNQFATQEKLKRYDRQDIHFMFSTAFSIQKWLEESRVDRCDFKSYLLSKVKLIVNRVGRDEEEKIFKNLNAYKVPLDGADLVRAILITRVAKEENKLKEDEDEHRIKNTIRINERRVRIGWELDEINNWWSHQKVRQYFEKFVSIESIQGETIQFQARKYPINYLLALYAERDGQDCLTLHYFEKEEKDLTAVSFYKELLRLHHTLKDWYEDVEFYHLLGLIFFQSYADFNEIWLLWTQTKTREQFKSELKNLIKRKIFNHQRFFQDSSIRLKGSLNWYKDEKVTLLRILLLLDVIIAIKDKQRLPIKGFTNSDNDIEHIFPQNPQAIQDKKEYLEYLMQIATGHDKRESQGLLRQFDAKHEDEKYQKRLDSFIQKQISGVNINSIGNLVLLHLSKNRELKNKPYAAKRAAIVDLINKGDYIQPHTLRVFVRYFKRQEKDGKELIADLNHWNNIDIESNLKSIESRINGFFNQ